MSKKDKAAPAGDEKDLKEKEGVQPDIQPEPKPAPENGTSKPKEDESQDRDEELEVEEDDDDDGKKDAACCK